MTLAPFINIGGRPKVAFLDWDGTFCDSRESIYEINLTMAKFYGVVMPSYEDWLKSAHPGVEPCMRSIGVTEDRESINAFFHQLLTEQREKGFQNPLYPGTHELLQFFQDEKIPAVIISRHLHDHLVQDIEAHGLSSLFHTIIGEPVGQDLKKDAEMRRICFGPLSVVRKNTLYLGDTVHDMVLARKAGVVPVAVTHGYDPRERLEVEGQPIIIVDSLLELLDQLR